MDPELKRFAQRVRSEVRKYVKRERQPPPITVYVSKGDSLRKVASEPAGHGATAGDVAENVRTYVLEARAKYAALVLLLHEPDGLTRSNALALIAASADGHTTAWQNWCVAGSLGAWEVATFRQENVAQLLRAATFEARRRAGFDVLFDRMLQSAVCEEDHPIVEELAGGLDALRGNPLSQSRLPRDEALFLTRVERWLDHGSGAVLGGDA
jgi:hypothetical protein